MCASIVLIHGSIPRVSVLHTERLGVYRPEDKANVYWIMNYTLNEDGRIMLQETIFLFLTSKEKKSIIYSQEADC